MIWLTWRQQRLELAIAASVLGIITVFLLKTGHDMGSAYQDGGLATCLAHHRSSAACQDLGNAFQTRFSSVTGLITWLNLLPLLFGVLIAAPFVLELEQGTSRLAWTQSITRRSWLTWKLAMIVGAICLSGLAMTGLMTWWNGPLDHLGSRLNPNQFDFEGVVPIAYTAFAAAVCLAAGTLLKRTLPAVGITLGAYLLARSGLEWARSLGAVTRYVPMDSGGQAGPTVPSRADYLIRATASIPKEVMRLCFGGSLNPPPAGSAAAQHVASCFSEHGVFASVVYQPGSRFWLFQGIESGLVLVPAAALLAFTTWWVRYRVT